MTSHAIDHPRHIAKSKEIIAGLPAAIARQLRAELAPNQFIVSAITKPDVMATLDPRDGYTEITIVEICVDLGVGAYDSDFYVTNCGKTFFR